MALFRWTRRRTKHFGEVWVPLAVIELQRSDGSFQAFAVQIDTGAVVSLLRRSVADVLGIDFDSGRSVDLESVGGSQTNARVHELHARIGDNLTLFVPFAISESETVPNLMGRLGFLDHLQVDFDASTHETKIAAPWLNAEGERTWRFMLDTGKHIEQRWDQLELPPPARRAAVHLYNKASALVAAVAGLIKLHRAAEAPILMRTLFEVAAQFEYLLRDPETRGRQFLDFAHVTKYRQMTDMVREPQGVIAKHVAESPLRDEGEARLKADYDRVKNGFLKGSGNQLWENWYRLSVRELAKQIGREDECKLWYRLFSNWVHADPNQADFADIDGQTMLVYCNKYYGRLLQRLADYGGIILTSEQHKVLKHYEKPFS